MRKDAFFHLSFEKGGAKELEWGLVKGLYVNLTDIPYESLGYCKPKRHPRSFIQLNSDVETRGQTTYRVFLFILIVKSEI